MGEPLGGPAVAGADQVTRFTAETIAARQRRAGAWILIALGVGCILFGGVFFAAKHSGHNVVATVTHEGPCSNGTCTVDVIYEVAGSQVAAVMYGVNSGEIYGPPSRRLLNITYQPGYEADPTTNDMPDAIWIGFGAAGLAFVAWGAWLRLRQNRPQRGFTVAAAGGAPADVAVHAAMASALGDRPASGGPAGISEHGPKWVSDESGAISIAERYPRWWAIIVTLFVAILPAMMFPALLSRRHVPAAVAYLTMAAAVAVWGCSRAWRIGLRLGDDGVRVRNHRRTYRIGWPEVRCFADGSVSAGEAGRLWALSIVLHDGRVVTASGTVSGRKVGARPQTLTAIRQAAERYAVPAELTGTATKQGSRESPANPGHYPDPGGQPGLRRWDGKQWSPFAGSGPQMTVGDIGVPAWAAGTPLPSEVTGGFPLPADVTGAAPSARRRRITLLTAAAVSAVAAVAVTAIVLGKTSAHKPTTTQAKPPAAARKSAPERAPARAAQPLLIYQLRPGDCLQGPPDVNTASWWPYVVMAVPCSEKHLAEVYFFSANYWPAAMAFPGHATIVHQATRECRKAFQAYDSGPPAASQYSFRDISPWDRVNWSSGDRVLLCTAYARDSHYRRAAPLYTSIGGSPG